MQIVDTKAASGGTYLHFLQRTIEQAEPDLEGFIEEITKPAEAYRCTPTRIVQASFDTDYPMQ